MQQDIPSRAKSVMELAAHKLSLSVAQFSALSPSIDKTTPHNPQVPLADTETPNTPKSKRVPRNIDNNPRTQEASHSQEPAGTTMASSGPLRPSIMPVSDTEALGNLTQETVYEFYTEKVLPAILASLPLLFGRLIADSKHYGHILGSRAILFLLPKHWAKNVEDYDWDLHQLWYDHISSSQDASIANFMLDHFDENHDGHISRDELLGMSRFMGKWHEQSNQCNAPSSWYELMSREWPLMDWKIGVFMWRTFGGIILLLCLLSIIPGRPHAISARILRWPVLGLTYFLIGVELCVYVMIRLGIRVAEIVVAKPRHRELRRKISKARTYEEWYGHAYQLDKSQRRDQWQKQLRSKTIKSKRYNWTLLLELMKDMKQAREKNDSLLALAVLQQCTRKNVGGIMSEDLFSYTNTGEPMHIVREFVDEVVETMEWVTDEALKQTGEGATTAGEKKSLEDKIGQENDQIWKSLINFATKILPGDSEEEEKEEKRPRSRRSLDASESCLSSASSRPSQTSLFEDYDEDFSVDSDQLASFQRRQVIDFFRRTRATFGRSALCLSGGGALGAYHFGHLKGLLEAGVLPTIISGTSAGSVAAAFVCCRTDEELMRDMRQDVLAEKLVCFSRPWAERIKGVIKDGHLFSVKDWADLLAWFTLGDMTFEEMYRKTGRVLCITVSATTKKAPPVLLNHLSAPNVTVASAILCSVAVPFFIPPMKLKYKNADGTVCENAREQSYFDGSIDYDIPVNGLAEMLNCQFFVAAQCNPHVAPFFFSAKGSVGRPTRWTSGNHEHSWRGGFLLATMEMYLKNDMKAKFRFLNEVEAAVGFTSTMFHQDFHGSTTLVPQMALTDYFKVFSNPTFDDMERYLQGGSVAAYENVAMIKMHYRIADALDECLDALVTGKRELKHQPGLYIDVYAKHKHEKESAHEEVYDTPVKSVEIRTKKSDNETLSTHSSVLSEEEKVEHWEPLLQGIRESE